MILGSPSSSWKGGLCICRPLPVEHWNLVHDEPACWFLSSSTVVSPVPGSCPVGLQVGAWPSCTRRDKGVILGPSVCKVGLLHSTMEYWLKKEQAKMPFKTVLTKQVLFLWDFCHTEGGTSTVGWACMLPFPSASWQQRRCCQDRS